MSGLCCSSTARPAVAPPTCGVSRIESPHVTTLALERSVSGGPAVGIVGVENFAARAFQSSGRVAS